MLITLMYVVRGTSSVIRFWIRCSKCLRLSIGALGMLHMHSYLSFYQENINAYDFIGATAVRMPCQSPCKTLQMVSQ